MCITLKLFRETGSAATCPWSVVNAGYGSRVGPRAASSCSEQKHCPRHVGNKHTYSPSAIYRSWKGADDLFMHIGILHLRSKCHVVTNKQTVTIGTVERHTFNPSQLVTICHVKSQKKKCPTSTFRLEPEKSERPLYPTSQLKKVRNTRMQAAASPYAAGGNMLLGSPPY